MGAGTHPCKLPLVSHTTPLPTEPLWLGFKFHIHHYILYIWLVALIAKVFYLVENLVRGGLEPTPVSYPWYDTRRSYQLSHSCLALRFHIGHYILYIWLVALIAKVFYLVENLVRGGLEPTPVSYPWYDTRRSYQLSHSCLALRFHIGHYILYIWLVALIAKVFYLVENLVRGGLEPTPVSYPWYDTRRPYKLSHSGLALSSIFAIIFCIFDLWR